MRPPQFPDPPAGVHRRRHHADELAHRAYGVPVVRELPPRQPTTRSGW